MYELLLKENVEKIFSKLFKKDRIKYEQIMKKLDRIVESPYSEKPLRNLMKGKWRVHIGEHVVIYEIDETKKIVKVVDYSHHDDAYRTTKS